jgi:hypothetical protein
MPGEYLDPFSMLHSQTSIISKSDAPRFAAEIRKPERRLWPAKIAGSSPNARLFE